MKSFGCHFLLRIHLYTWICIHTLTHSTNLDITKNVLVSQRTEPSMEVDLALAWISIHLGGLRLKHQHSQRHPSLCQRLNFRLAKKTDLSHTYERLPEAMHLSIINSFWLPAHTIITMMHWVLARQVCMYTLVTLSINSVNNTFIIHIWTHTQRLNYVIFIILKMFRSCWQIGMT